MARSSPAAEERQPPTFMRAPLRLTRMPARQNPRALSHTRRKCPVNTICLCLAKATTSAARHAGHHPRPLHLVVASPALRVAGVDTTDAALGLIILAATLAAALRTLTTRM